METIFPWNVPELRDWSIVGMNHYHVDGERRLFVAMTRDGACITAEGPDEGAVFRDLDKKAWQHRRKAAIEGLEADAAARERDTAAVATKERSPEVEHRMAMTSALYTVEYTPGATVKDVMKQQGLCELRAVKALADLVKDGFLRRGSDGRHYFR